MFNGLASELGTVAVVAAFAMVMLAYLVLIIAALVGIVSARLTGGMKLVWCVLVFLAPFLGSLLWFVVGRNNVQALRY